MTKPLVSCLRRFLLALLTRAIAPNTMATKPNMKYLPIKLVRSLGVGRAPVARHVEVGEEEGWSASRLVGMSAAAMPLYSWRSWVWK